MLKYFSQDWTISRCGLPLTYIAFAIRLEVVRIVEVALIQIIHLLLFGMVAETIVAVALIILVIISSK